MSPLSTPADGAAPRPVVLVGAGERARAWLDPLRRSTRLRVVATVARGAPIAADLPHHDALPAALAAYPEAAFAVALPPRAGLEAALALAAGGRAGVVQAPLHDALCDLALPPGADAVRVGHGWVTLPGLRAVEAILRRVPGGRVAIDVGGLPEEPAGDVAECLVHALALVRAFFPAAVARSARLAGDGVEVELAAERWTIALRLRRRGPSLAVRIEAGAAPALWTWENGREQVLVGERPLVAARTTPTAAVRALAQLLPSASRGDGLPEAAAALRLTRACLDLLPSRLPPPARSLRHSASLAARRPDDLLGRLGLVGDLPTGAGRPPERLELAAPREPFELWAFRAGLKPVTFLTVRPDDVEATLAYFGDVHCERRERRVQVEAQDRWLDRRDAGEPRVELYISRDPALASRAAHLQAERDPSAALRDLGELVGYPPCCVDAFARQDDRANNSANRYHSHARTLAADGTSPLPWPWELNNLHTMVVPFYPCSYRCAAALAWARRSLAELAGAHPAFVEALRALLARPVLYFDHDHQVVLDGTYADGGVAYRAVALAPASSAGIAPLAGAIAAGDRLSLDDAELVVERGGRTVLHLKRTDPALGFVAPFGA